MRKARPAFHHPGPTPPFDCLDSAASDETMRPSRPFPATLLAQLKDPQSAALYLEEALAAGDAEAFKLACAISPKPASAA
jgi:hypothetical protein